MIVVLTERHWCDLVELTDSAEAVAALDKHLLVSLSTDAGRFTYRELVAGLLRPWFEARTLGEVEAALTGTSLLWSRYRDFLEVVEDEAALAANPMMGLIDQPGVGPHLAPGTPLDLVGFTRASGLRAPRLGEHTDDVLREVAGVSDDELAELHDEGVVAGPSDR
jgi:2-methylfumaryl-CoA isomerase